MLFRSPYMPFVKQLDFISNSAPTLRTLATDIRMACGQGMSVIINNWLANNGEAVFDVDVISTHRDVYKEVEWQGEWYNLLIKCALNNTLIDG